MFMNSILKVTSKARDKNNLVYFPQVNTKHFPFIYMLLHLNRSLNVFEWISNLLVLVTLLVI